MQGIETCLHFTFTFEIRDHKCSLYTTERQYLLHILLDEMFVSGAQDLQIIRHCPLSFISPYSIYVESEILGTVM